MARYIIKGGTPLRGRVKILGAKNVGFKLLIASLLADSPSTIDNVAKTGDVEATYEIIEGLGGKVEWVGEHKLKVNPTGLSNFDVAGSHGGKTRAPTLCVGPLVSRFGRAYVFAPGGDAIGRRPIDRHIRGFESLGLIVQEKNGGWEFSGNLSGGNYRFEKNSHLGTESLILAGVLAKGNTTIENAADEPEIDDLVNFLNQMGAKIKRTELRTIEIEGVQKLSGTDYTVMPDRNEAVTFACAALLTNGNLEIEGARSEHLQTFEQALNSVGASYEFSENKLHIWRKPESYLKSTNITTAPHPGFMTDWQPIWTTLMTQAEGESIVHEAVFENRFGFVQHLKKMGANIELFNPKVKNSEEFYNFNLEDDKEEYFHAAKISGPTKLKGTNLEVPDIRAGATLTLAALAAEGKSELLGIEHIERGYERLEERLKGLSAKIWRSND